MIHLQTALADVNGATFIGLDTTTVVKLTGGKKNPLQGRVTKRMVGASVMAFQNKATNGYENMVKRRLEAEGKDPATFVLGERAWGTRVPNLPIVTHNGKEYLEVIFMKPGKTELLVDGLPHSGPIEGLDQHAEGEQGGLENKVIIRTFALESIDSLTINKTTYTK